MIDSHHHLWNYTDEEFGWIESDTIRRDFLSPDLDALLSENEISAAIAVQARCTPEENDFLLAQAANSTTIKGIVGWVDLKSDLAASQLDTLSANPLFKGVREITQGAEDADYFTHPAFQQGIKAVTQRDLTYDVLIFQNQLPAATAFIDAHPQQRFVLDHAAKPEIRADSFPESWQKHIREIAKRDNLVCKISGLATEVRDADWDNALMQRYIDTLLDSFGPSRLMFGSDWPVSLLATDYARWKHCLCSAISSLSEHEQLLIKTNTASQFYSI